MLLKEFITRDHLGEVKKDISLHKVIGTYYVKNFTYPLHSNPASTYKFSELQDALNKFKECVTKELN